MYCLLVRGENRVHRRKFSTFEIEYVSNVDTYE